MKPSKNPMAQVFSLRDQETKRAFVLILKNDPGNDVSAQTKESKELGEVAPLAPMSERLGNLLQAVPQMAIDEHARGVESSKQGIAHYEKRLLTPGAFAAPYPLTFTDFSAPDAHLVFLKQKTDAGASIEQAMSLLSGALGENRAIAAATEEMKKSLQRHQSRLEQFMNNPPPVLTNLTDRLFFLESEHFLNAGLEPIDFYEVKFEAQ